MAILKCRSLFLVVIFIVILEQCCEGKRHNEHSRKHLKQWKRGTTHGHLHQTKSRHVPKFSKKLKILKNIHNKRRYVRSADEEKMEIVFGNDEQSKMHLSRQQHGIDKMKMNNENATTEDDAVNEEIMVSVQKTEHVLINALNTDFDDCAKKMICSVIAKGSHLPHDVELNEFESVIYGYYIFNKMELSQVDFTSKDMSEIKLRIAMNLGSHGGSNSCQMMYDKCSADDDTLIKILKQSASTEKDVTTEKVDDNTTQK